jgi:hypothetical protein
MSRKIGLMFVLLITALFTSTRSAPALAVKPVVTNVVVWNNGGNTTLNVTVSHYPQSSFHHADAVEVNVSGTIETLMVPLEPTTEFVIVFDLGSIAGTPLATIRAHCTIDEWGPSYGPIQVPEFLSPILLLALIFTTTLSVAVCRRFKTKTRK